MWFARAPLRAALLSASRSAGTPEALLGSNAVMWFRMGDADTGEARVPNSLYPAAKSKNRLFYTTAFTGNITGVSSVTYRAAVGPGGDQSAVRLVVNTGSTCTIVGPVVFPAGVHVLTYSVRNGVAGSITFGHGRTGPTTSYQDVAVNAADWTPITTTIVADGVTAYSLGFRNISGAQQTLDFDRFQFYLAADGAPPDFASEVVDLSLTRNLRLAGSLPITSGLLDVTTTGQVLEAKLPGYPANTTFPGVSLFATMRQTGHTASRALVLACSDPTQAVHNPNGYTRFRFGPVGFGAPVSRSYLELVYPGGNYQAPMDMMAYPDALQTAVGLVDVNGAKILVDGYEVGPVELIQPLTAPLTEPRFKFFGAQSASLTPPSTETVTALKLAEFGMAKARVSDADAVAITDLMRSYASAQGHGIVDSSTITFPEGDSIFHGHPTEINTCVAHALRYETSPPAWVIPTGAAGSILGEPLGVTTPHLTLWGRLPRLLRNLARAKAQGRRRIIIGYIGPNDHARIISSWSTYLNDLKAYWAAIKAADPDVIILWSDVLARGDFGTFTSATAFNLARHPLNAGIAASVTEGLIDDLLVVGTHPIMGTDAAPSNPELFDNDLLHPTRPVGQGLIRESVRTTWEEWREAA